VLGEALFEGIAQLRLKKGTKYSVERSSAKLRSYCLIITNCLSDYGCLQMPLERIQNNIGI